MRRLLPVLVVVFAVGWAVRGLRGCPTGGVDAPPLVLGEMPVQEALPEPIDVRIERDGASFRIRKTHRYRVVGEVLSASTYTIVFANEFFDVDLGLAWGDHVPALKERFTFYQDHRWLFWRSDGPVTDAERLDVTTHIGNEHLIPDPRTPRIDRAIRWADVGDVVAIEGFLVTVSDAAGKELVRSSTSRTDTGGGACEVVWVERFQNGRTVWE